MKLIKLNPKTPGTRHQIKLSKNLLAKKSTLYKKLFFKIPNISGRSPQTGHITAWHRGGGCKKLYRQIKFNNINSINIILSINYDPYRSTFVSFCFDIIKRCFFFTPTTHTTFPGSIQYINKSSIELNFGNRTTFFFMPVGVLVHNITLSTFKDGKYSRAAGTFSQIIQKKEKSIFLKLTSGKIIQLNEENYATFGRVSNLKHNLIITGKAGRNRNLGIRPTVRGVAMNPVDHPHGGRTKGGRPSVSPWGKLTKGKPTAKNYD